MIWPHNHQGASLRIHSECLICMPMAGVVALLVRKDLGQSFARCQCAAPKEIQVARAVSCLPFIPHLPVTGVKKSGISSCSTFFLSDAITKTRSMTLSG